jgi:hypothetical protein
MNDCLMVMIVTCQALSDEAIRHEAENNPVHDSGNEVLKSFDCELR